MNTPFIYPMPMDKNMIFYQIEWCISKCPGLCTISYKTFTWYLKFVLYRAVF